MVHRLHTTMTFDSPDIEEGDIVDVRSDRLVIYRGDSEIWLTWKGLKDYLLWIQRNAEHLPGNWGELAGQCLEYLE